MDFSLIPEFQMDDSAVLLAALSQARLLLLGLFKEESSVYYTVKLFLKKYLCGIAHLEDWLL